MSTHPCPTCGHVHEAPPTVDWTGYEDAVREYVDAWLAEQEHQLDRWRQGIVIRSGDFEASKARYEADAKVSGYLRARFGKGYLVVNVLGGEVLWSPSDSDLPFVVIYTHADGPIRPDGAA